MQTVDLFPTLLELGGLPAPQQPIDGRSFARQVLGEAATTSRVQYWHYPHYHRGSGMKPAGAIRRDNYKLLEWYEPHLAGEEGAIELYDLDNDISEQYNLADSLPEIAAELQQSLAEWREQTKAQMPALRGNKNSKGK